MDLVREVEAEDSLEEGEIASPPPSPHRVPPLNDYYEVVSDDESLICSKKRHRPRRRKSAWSPSRKLSHSYTLPYRRPSTLNAAKFTSPYNRKKKCKRRNSVDASTDFDLMRSKLLQRLQQKVQSNLGTSQEFATSRVSDIEMENVSKPLADSPTVNSVNNLTPSPEKPPRVPIIDVIAPGVPEPITVQDSEEEVDLEQLRAHALLSQRTPNKRDNIPVDPDPTENEFSLRAEALRTAILKKRPFILKKKFKKKEQLKEPVEKKSVANDHVTTNKEETKSGDGKENQDDENLLRQQLLATLPNRNKTSIEPQQHDSASTQETDKNPLKTSPSTSNKINTLDFNITPSLKDQNFEIKASLKPIDKTNSSSSAVNLNSKVLQTLNPAKSKGRKIPQSKMVKTSEESLSNRPPLKRKTASKLINVVTENQSKLRKANHLVNISEVVPERIVVSLGPDSSDEEGEGGKPDDVKHKASGALADSIDQYLMDARRRMETASTSTPEAVHAHLPPSQRLEYLELKKKLAEKEKNLKKMELNQTFNKIQPSVQTSSTHTQSNVKNNFPNISANYAARPSETKQLLSSNQSTKNVANKIPIKSSPPNSSVNSGFKNSQQALKSKGTVVPPRSKALPAPEDAKNSNPVTQHAKPSIALKQAGTKFPSKNHPAVTATCPNTPAILNPAKKLRIELLMNLLAKELAMEKDARDELARLKLQMSYAEQKRMGHATRAGHLRTKIQRLLGPTKKRPLPSTSTASHNKSSNEKKREVAVATCTTTCKETGKTEEMDMRSLQIAEKNGGIVEGKMDSEEATKKGTLGSMSNAVFTDYESPLGQVASDLDPNKALCFHDLAGTCRDPDCVYQHTRSKGESESSSIRIGLNVVKVYD